MFQVTEDSSSQSCKMTTHDRRKFGGVVVLFCLFVPPLIFLESGSSGPAQQRQKGSEPCLHASSFLPYKCIKFKPSVPVSSDLGFMNTGCNTPWKVHDLSIPKTLHPVPMKHKLFFLHCPVDLEQNKTLKEMERILGCEMKEREHLLKENDGR